MQDNNLFQYIKKVVENMPNGWLTTTTHRLDIYNEKLAKTEFLDQFENLKCDCFFFKNHSDISHSEKKFIRKHKHSNQLFWEITRLF